MNIEADAARAVETVRKDFRNLFRDGHPADAPATAAAPRDNQPEARPMSLLSTVHRDLGNAGAAIQHAWPILTSIATNPLLDELIEAALTAAGAGVAAETFQAAIDGFKGATDRKAGTAGQIAAAVDAAQHAAQQPSFTPADGTSGQPAQA